MKKLTGALFLSLSLLLISGCRSAGETRDGEDASTPPGSDATASPSRAIDAARDAMQRDASGTPPSAGQPAVGVDLGGMKQDSGEGSTAAALSTAERKAQETCLDKWLKDKKMDPYGHPEGTMYAGGSPLFNEMTGESRDRLDYIYQRQPEAKKVCASPKNK
jgi:hypothetical protein